MQRPELAPAAEFFRQHCGQDRGNDALHLPAWSIGDWQALLSRARPLALARDEVLFRRGVDTHSLFLVVGGALQVSARGSGGSLGGLFRAGPGALIGEIAFFDGGARSATVWATEPTRLLSLDRADVEAFAAAHPQRGLELLLALGRVLAFHVRRSEQHAATDAF